MNAQPVEGPVAVAGDSVWGAFLEPGAGSIEGWLLKDGAYAARATVILPEIDLPRWFVLLTAVSDSEVGFVWENLPPGTCRILAREFWQIADRWEYLATVREQGTLIRVNAKTRTQTILRVD